MGNGAIVAVLHTFASNISTGKKEQKKKNHKPA